MKKQRLVKRIPKAALPIVSTLLLTLAVVLIVSGLVVWRLHLSVLRKQATRTPTSTQPQLSNSFITPPPKIPVQTFTSSELGISFHYRNITDPSGQTIYPVFTKELGNKVYIYQGDFQPDQDKYVEVVSKIRTQSIADAIRQLFLEGYAVTCRITIQAQPRKYSPTTYIRAWALPVNRYANPPQCPGYLLGGVEYFLMDTAHPDKLLFFHIGQDNYGSGIYYGSDFKDELTWDTTLTFLDTK